MGGKNVRMIWRKDTDNYFRLILSLGDRIGVNEWVDYLEEKTLKVELDYFCYIIHDES